MKRILTEFEKMPAREMIDCRITGLRDILIYYGLPIDSFLLFLISGGINFSFIQKKYRESSNIYIWLIGGSPLDLEENLLRNLGIEQTNYFQSREEEGFSSLKELIDNDIPPIVLIDSNYIHNHPIEKDNTKFYIGALSSIPLVGYDLEKEIVYFDLKDDENKGLYTLSMNDFMMARSAKCFPYSPENKYYTINIDNEKTQWVKDNLKDILKKGLMDICSAMLMKNDGNDLECYGISGIGMVGKVLSDFNASLKEADLPQSVSDKLFTIKIRCLRQGMLPGSNTLYREEFGKALKKLSGYYGTSSFNELGDEFIKIGNKWREVARLLGYADYAIRDKNKVISKASEGFYKLEDLEEAAFTKLFKLLFT